MKSLSFMFITLLFCLNLMAQTQSAVIKKITGGFKHPESVASDGRFYYVSNLGDVLNPTAKDGDGFITKLNKFGEILEMNAFPNIKLNSPKGMTVMNDVLFITDVDSILGIDVRTKKQVWGKTIEGPKFLNDILARDENTLYVSATDVHQLYEIDLFSDSIRIISNEFTPQSPNGLSADLVSSFLFVVSYGTENFPGEIGRLNLRNGEYEKVIEESGLFDGIFYMNGRYYVSDWGINGKGRLFVYDIRKENIREIKPDKGFFKGPADFYFDIPTKHIWLPCMLENAVYILNAK